MNDAEFLRYLAQNDYMIDQYFLEDGNRLLAIADTIETLLPLRYTEWRPSASID